MSLQNISRPFRNTDTFSLRKWVHKTSLTLPLFMEVPTPSEKM